MPETLIPALDELEREWLAARADPASTPRTSSALMRDYVGRPTPLYRADATVGGRRRRACWLKREDLTHTGSHKINNAIGQALLARRMGKPRVIAETGAGQHGVATATACALLGLECVVYMGTEDIRRQRPNVERMRLLGAEVVGVEAGARTLKEAISAAIRDWVGQRRDDPLRDRVRGRARRPIRRSCATCSAASATRPARSCSRRPAGCPTG